MGSTVIWKPTEIIGGLVATFTIYNIYLGVYLASLILYLSLIYFFKGELKKNSFYYLICIILLMLSWPLFLGTTNALRQGLSISIFIALISVIKNNSNFNLFFIFKLLTLIIILALSHSYGLLLAINFIFFYLFFIKIKIPLFFTIILSSFLLFLIDDFRDGVEYIADPTGFDSRLPIAICAGLTIIFFNIFINKSRALYINIILFFCATIYLFSFKYFNNSLVYERLMWVPVVCSLLVMSDFFKNHRLIGYKSILIYIYFFYCVLSIYAIGFNYY
jgi:hypothetical protein